MSSLSESGVQPPSIAPPHGISNLISDKEKITTDTEVRGVIFSVEGQFVSNRISSETLRNQLSMKLK